MTLAKFFAARAQHGRPADVDVLDRLGLGDAGLGDGGLEGVEVHAHQVDHADAVLVGRRHVRGNVSAGEKASVDARVQRLDAAVHHLGKAGEVVDGAHRYAGVCKRLGGAAGRDDLDAELVDQRAAELDDAGLVGH